MPLGSTSPGSVVAAATAAISSTTLSNNFQQQQQQQNLSSAAVADPFNLSFLFANQHNHQQQQQQQQMLLHAATSASAEVVVVAPSASSDNNKNIINSFFCKNDDYPFLLPNPSPALKSAASIGTADHFHRPLPMLLRPQPALIQPRSETATNGCVADRNIAEQLQQLMMTLMVISSSNRVEHVQQQQMMEQQQLLQQMAKVVLLPTATTTTTITNNSQSPQFVAAQPQTQQQQILLEQMMWKLLTQQQIVNDTVSRNMSNDCGNNVGILPNELLQQHLAYLQQYGQAALLHPHYLSANYAAAVPADGCVAATASAAPPAMMNDNSNDNNKNCLSTILPQAEAAVAAPETTVTQQQHHDTVAMINNNNKKKNAIGTSPAADIAKTELPTVDDQLESISRNKLGRSYNPGRPLGMLDRQKILNLYQKGLKISHIAKVIGVTHSCVSKIMTRYRRTGSIYPRSAQLIHRRPQLGHHPQQQHHHHHHHSPISFINCMDMEMVDQEKHAELFGADENGGTTAATPLPSAFRPPVSARLYPTDHQRRLSPISAYTDDVDADQFGVSSIVDQQQMINIVGKIGGTEADHQQQQQQLEAALKHQYLVKRLLDC